MRYRLRAANRPTKAEGVLGGVRVFYPLYNALRAWKRGFYLDLASLSDLREPRNRSQNPQKQSHTRRTP